MPVGNPSFVEGYTPWNKGKESPKIMGDKHPGWKGGKPFCQCGKQLVSRSNKTGKCFKCYVEARVGMNERGKLGAMKRWNGHIAQPKKQKQGLWVRSFDPLLQLQKKRFRNQRYKANKRDAEGTHTFEQWMELKVKYNLMCLCCKQFEPDIKLTEDHIIPLSIGGSDNIDNIQPLCQNCNTRKMTKTISYLPLSFNNLNLEEKGLVN